MIKFKRFDYEMVRDKYSILFYIRKSKKDPSMGTLYTRLTLNGSMIELCCTGIQSSYADFDTKKQKLKDQEQNKILTQLTADIIYFIENTPSPTPKRIRDLINGKASLNPPMVVLLKMYLEQNAMYYEPSTLKDWRVKIGVFEIYLRQTNQINLDARQFGIVGFSRFKSWLMKERDNNETSANKYGLKFRKALKWATMQGLLSQNPLRDCQLPTKYDIDLTHLEWNWVEKLRTFDFESKLKKAVDMYVFSCCTGICYADMMNLKAEHLENHSEFGLIITNKRQKVKSAYSTPLWGFAKEIYEEFGGLENIPKMTNQRVNDYIKIALHKIGYEKAEEITFHTGRKTFVNYCLNDRLLEPHIVATFTGHQKIEEIKAYGKVKKETAIKSFYRN